MASVVFAEIVLDDDLVLLLNHVLSPFEQSKAVRFVQLKDRNSYVLAHALKRLVLASESGLDMNDLLFSTNAFGKPELLNSKIPFNLSHTAGMVAFSWSVSGSVGVDIEHVDHHHYNKGTAKMVLSDMEYCALEQAEDRQRSFIKMWTIKEAVAKAEGRGMDMDFRQLVAVNNCVVTESSTWNVMSCYPSLNHIATLAISSACNETVVVYKTLDLDVLIRLVEQKQQHVDLDCTKEFHAD